MKKLLLLSSALLVLTASLASAQMNFAWNSCLGVGAHAMNMNYACDGSRNGIPFRAVMSFKDPLGMPAFVGIQAVVDIQTVAPVLPDYWRLGLGECRDGNLIFPGGLIGVGGLTCQNLWAGANTGGGYDYATGFGGANKARLRVSFARDTPRATTYGQHYVAGVIELDTFGDVPPPPPLQLCDGCLVPGCLVLNSIELYQVAGSPPTDIYAITTVDQRNWITWQGGDPSCAFQTPTKNRTWGSVKSLYR